MATDGGRWKRLKKNCELIKITRKITRIQWPPAPILATASPNKATKVSGDKRNSSYFTFSHGGSKYLDLRFWTT